MRTRIISIMAAVAVLACTVASTTYGQDYLDRMNQLTQQEFISENALTREDFCVVIAKVFYADFDDEAELPFADADLLAPESVPYLAKLYANGILQGVPVDDRLYVSPESGIVRQEAITLLGRVLDIGSDAALEFADAGTIAPYALSYVSWFVEQGIVLGYPDGTFGPETDMTAEELAALVIRTLEYRDQPAEAPAEEATSAYTVSTLMGNGSRGLVDGNISLAQFLLPYSAMSSPRSSEIIVFDTYNNAIRSVLKGETTTVAGSINKLDENRFPAGDYKDSVVSRSLLNRPTGGVFDSNGDLYICDSGNNAIRKISGSRMITFADKVFNNPMAIAIDAEDTIYVADTLNNCIRTVSPDGEVTVLAGTAGKEGFANGAAASALFREPSGIAVHEGAVYVADTGNHLIRKIADGVVTTVAGFTDEADEDGYPYGGFENGAAETARFSLPMGITVANGDIIVADSGNNMIRAIKPDGNVITLVGNGEPGDEDGPALSAMLNQPMGVQFLNGVLYISDTYNNKIKSLVYSAQ